MNNNIFRIDGMTCDGCVSTIKTKLELENDISKAIVTLGKHATYRRILT